MDIRELEQFNLDDAVKFHARLNPRLWGRDEHLLPEVQQNLLAIADDFREFLGVPDLRVQDITISGSNAAYSYTDHSDIDLHLVVDMPEDPVYRELFDAKKYQYNDQHDYHVGPYKVELYVQDSEQPHYSQGIYSVKDKTWRQVPRRRKAQVDDDSVRHKYEDLGARAEAAIDSGNLDRMRAIMDRIKAVRQSGLEQNGEFGAENLAFKLLRNTGVIERLVKARNRAKDHLLSISERKKKKRSGKSFAYGSFGGWFYPGYSFDSGSTGDAGGGDGGGGESVREDDTGMAQGSEIGDAGAQSTWDGVSRSTQTFLSEGPKTEILRDFIRRTVERLKLENPPSVVFHKNSTWAEKNRSFGQFDPKSNRLHVSLPGRHVMDIMRTIAHELTHAKQNEKYALPDVAGETGSDWENSANAMAGIIMRDMAQANPGLFEMMHTPVSQDSKSYLDYYNFLRAKQKMGRPLTKQEQQFLLSYYAVSQIKAQNVAESDLDESVLNKAAAAAALSAALAMPALAQNQPQSDQRQSPTVGQILNRALTIYGISKIREPQARAEVEQEFRNYLRAQQGDPNAQNLSKIYQWQQQQKLDEGASGYIPTKKQARDPRFSTALTVDIQPGQVGKEANKLNLKTDSQGRPSLLAKGLANALREFKETGIISERCWTGYRQQGMKRKGDRMVPNCVKVSEADVEEAAPGGIGWSHDPKDIEKIRAWRREETGTQSRMFQGYTIKFLPQGLFIYKGGDLVFKKPGDFSNPTNQDIVSAKAAITRLINKQIKESQDQESKDGEDLFEVKMSPGELEKWANSEEAEGIQAGFEAELIFRDTSRDDDEGEPEPDWDADQRADSIESVVDFFQGGDNGIGRNTANRVRDRLYEELYDWQMEQIDREWEREAEDQVRDWMRNNISPNEYRDQAAEELDIDSDQPSEDEQKAIDQRAAELFDQAIDSAIENQDDNYERAREQFYDYRRDDTDYDEESFLSDRYRYMSEIGNEFDLDWPYWTEGSSGNGGSRTPEEIADSLSSELGGAEVRASSGYHSTSRKPGRWIIEPDGSLGPDDSEDAGLEVVSPPMPLPEALRSLRTVIDWANSDGDAYTNGSTGLHMGVSIPHKGGDVDYVKLILFLGDRYVLDQFGRSANSYTRSALDKLKDVQRSRRSTNEAEGLTGAEKTAAAMELMKRNLIELAQRYVQDGVGRDKYTSAHIKDGYIEFRSPGGDYLSMDSRDESALANTMLRFARAMYIAGRPDLERKEYAKKLYQLIDTQGDDALKLFMDYTTGQINQEELKKNWARQVLAKEQPRKVEQEYEVYDKNTGETLETLRFARGEGEGMVSAAIADVIEKYSGQGMDISLRRPGEPEVEISRRAKIAKKISDRPTVYRVEAGDRSILVQAQDTEAAKQRAREQDDHFQQYRTITVTPATAEEIKQYQAQARDNTQDRQDIEQRVTGSSQEQRYRVSWTERRDGREITDSLGVTARNADAAMASVRSALEAQGRRPITISADPAPIAGSTLDLAQQRAQQAAGNDQPTGDWIDQLGRELRQQAGTWTGHWIVQDGQGRELTRFHGIGNNQSDANRHAARWLGTNRPDLAGQEIEVVPEVR